MLVPLWQQLSLRRRKQLIFLFLVMIISAGVELFSLATVIPFLALLSDPDSLSRYPIIISIGSYLGFSSPSEFILPAAFIFACTAILVALIRSINFWLNGRLAAAIGADLSYEAYRRTLYQPYEVHLKRNSSSIINTTTTQISRCVSGFSAFLQLSTSSLVSISLLIGLCFVDWRISLLLGSLFGSIYAVISIITRRRLRSNSLIISLAAKQQIKCLQEGLGSIRNVLLDGTHSNYLYQYSNADRQLRILQANNIFLGTFPRYAVEAFGLVVVAIMGGFMAIKQGSVSTTITLLGTFALGSQRLLPALQQAYSGWSALRSFNADFYAVLQMLAQDIPSVTTAQNPLPLRESILLRDISYKYSASQPIVLKCLNIEIFRGERIGVVGVTGSGKSTFIDILMGLLCPTSGRIFVDGNDLHDIAVPSRLNAWRSTLAHVPQNIYLSDCSIAENIALGIPFDQIDIDRVRDCAAKAQIADFIESTPGSYSNVVGERGVRLSGGQRQRIGIARALYKRAKVLIFDEATSALDTTTEEAVMESIEGLSNDLTIIMIAHRLSTVQSCDRIIRFADGEITSDASPTSSKS